MDGIVYLLLFIAAVNFVSFVALGFITTEIRQIIKDENGILDKIYDELMK